MRKTIRTYKNSGKALELRLEQEESDKYFVVLAGITVNLSEGCHKGICEGGGEGKQIFVDQETYIHEIFPDFRKAEEVYSAYKDRYLL